MGESYKITVNQSQAFEFPYGLNFQSSVVLSGFDLYINHGTSREFTIPVGGMIDNVPYKNSSGTTKTKQFRAYWLQISKSEFSGNKACGILLKNGRLSITSATKFWQLADRIGVLDYDTAFSQSYSLSNAIGQKVGTFTPNFRNPISETNKILCLIVYVNTNREITTYVSNVFGNLNPNSYYGIIPILLEDDRELLEIGKNEFIVAENITVGYSGSVSNLTFSSGNKITKTTYTVNSSQKETYSGTTSYETINNINGLANSGYFDSVPLSISFDSSAGTKKVSLNFNTSRKNFITYTNKTKSSISFNVIDDTTYTYYLDTNGNNYSLYVGQTLPDSIYASIKLVQERHNEFISQPDVDYKTSLTSSDLVANIDRPTLDTTNIEFTYQGSEEVSSPITLDVSSKLIKLASDNSVFGLVLKTYYDIGDVFSFNDIINEVKTNGSLYYTDGTVLHISDYVDDFEITISDSTLEDNTEITGETPSTFTYKINFQSSVFGNYVYEASASIREEELVVVSAELVNYKNHFKYGELISFGNDASIQLKNASGDVVKTIQNSEIRANLSSIDTNYNKVINEENSQFLTDNEFTLSSTLKDYDLQIVQKFKVSYPKEASFNYSAVKKLQYWLPEEFDTFKFDLDGIIVTIEYHDNSTSPTNIQRIEKEVELENGIGLVSNVNTKEYRIELSYTYEGRTFSNNGLIITAEKVRPVAIIIDNQNAEENATSYWNTGETFKYPNGFTFKIQYNAIKEDETKNYSELSYYWNGNQLTVGQTILSQYDSVGNQNPTSIEVRYYYQVDTYVSGTFSITWRENSISSVDINSTDPISLTLGNSLNTLKNYFPIRITYNDTSVVDNYTDFSFKNGDTILMSAPSEIVVIVKENGENKEWTLSSNKYVFNKPKISSITLNLTNVSTIINNAVDGIDLTNLIINVAYENAEYIETVSTYKYLQTSESLDVGEFTATNSTLGTSFHYDGSSITNISLSSQEVEKVLPITIQVVNAFGVVSGDNPNTTTLNVRVIEITNITGLSIERVFEDYHIGDKFLDDTIETNENCTQVWVWYKDGQDTQRRILVSLKDSLKSLNIFPRPNTIFYKTERNKTIRVSAATNPTVYVEYTINVEAKYVQSDTTKTTDLVVVYNPDSYTLPNGNTISGKYLIVNQDDTQVVNGIRSLVSSLSWSSVKVYGYLEDIGDRTKNARVILFEDYIPAIDGQSNIVCEFPCYVKGNAEQIDKCTIGHLFGNNNAKNRLFVSGNPNMANCDWHSGAVNTSKQEGDVANENGDFTYFEDTSYCFYGQTDNHIVGYDIVSNDRLVVLKSKSDKEPTIYYRTSGLVQAVNGSGSNVVGLNNEALYEEQYPLSIGNIGTGALSNRAIINFNGDTLFMSSDKELDGLDVTGIIGDFQRYANSRSKYIDPAFKELDLDGVSLWTNQKYLFLITKDEIFITHYEAYNSETSQYEWWRFDIKDVQVMLEIDNEIYFGNSNGELFLLNSDIYADKDKIFIRNGATSLATIDEANDTLAIASSIIEKLNESETLTFKVKPDYDGEGNVDYTSCLFYQIAYINNSKSANSGNIDLYVNTEYNALELIATKNGVFNPELYETLVNKIDSNIPYFLNYSNNGNNDYSIGASSNSIFKSLYTPFYLKLVEDTPNTNNLCYGVYDKDGNRLDVSELYYANLVACLDKEYSITDIDKENSTFRIVDQNEMKIDIVRYGDQDTLHALSGEISKYNNVHAYYISAPFTLGDLMYNKTIWSWTLTNDTELSSYVEVCEATNNIDFENMSKIVALNISHGYDLDNFDFNKINFSKSVVPFKYTFIRPLLVPFICFGFKNNENSNAVLCSMQIIYSKPSISFGKGK